MSLMAATRGKQCCQGESAADQQSGDRFGSCRELPSEIGDGIAAEVKETSGRIVAGLLTRRACCEKRILAAAYRRRSENTLTEIIQLGRGRSSGSVVVVETKTCPEMGLGDKKTGALRDGIEPNCASRLGGDTETQRCQQGSW